MCGLSNGHDTGYLILGAELADDEGWRLTPIAFPNDDPPSAITDLLAGGGVTPYPDGLDVREFPANNTRALTSTLAVFTAIEDQRSSTHIRTDRRGPFVLALAGVQCDRMLRRASPRTHLPAAIVSCNR